VNKYISTYFFLLIMTIGDTLAMAPPRPTSPIFESLYIESSGALIAGTVPEVYFRSTDDGRNWTQFDSSAYVPMGIGATGLRSGTDAEQQLCRPTAATSHWYCVGIGQGLQAVTSAGVTYRCSRNELEVSKDWGKHWKKTASRSSSGAKGPNCSHAAAQGDVVYALGNHLHKSTDQGAHWTLVRQGATSDSLIPGEEILGMTMDRRGVLYANTTAAQSPRWSVYSSTDGGLKWTRQTFGLPAAWQVFTLKRVLPDAIYFVARKVSVGGQGEPIYRSVDGKSATPMNLPADVQWVDLKVGPHGALYVVGVEAIYKSSDSGKTWRKLGIDGMTF
jgi:hypothetical protein